MTVFTNLTSEELINISLKRGEGVLTDTEALLTTTGLKTGRSPMDRFIVRDPMSAGAIDWGDVNRPISDTIFVALWQRVSDYLNLRDTLVGTFHVGADERYGIPVKVITETAWHSLFAQNMFIQTANYNSVDQREWELLHAADFVCDTKRDGTASDGVVMINFERQKILIAGMKYAGEMKKAVFSVQNFLLPMQNVLPMHCAASVGENGDTCLFFGLSGTGKTTLSADSNRYLNR